MNRKKIVLIISITVIIILAAISSVFLLNKKENKEKKGKVAVVEQLIPLEKANASEAAELVKKNIVKVINTIDENNKIIGTGFFDKTGYLVTNSHIVDIKGRIDVEYADGTKSNASIYSNNITSDIALLTVDKVKVKAMHYGNTLNLKITDDVYAIGYPYALEGEASVTKGVLSARRSAGGIEFLQSDISLNQGNSGGPLINAKGELLAINTYSTENASIGMSISAESLTSIIDKLLKSKEIEYLEDGRPTNALSIVLTEIGYNIEDIYNENQYLNKKNTENENEEKHEDINNQGNGNSNSNNNHRQTAKDYEITSVDDMITYRVGDTLSNDINTYFKLGKDLTNCTLDTSHVNMNEIGYYPVYITCKENSRYRDIKVKRAPLKYDVYVPEINVGESKNNVTKLEEVSGIWYYPGYADACQSFVFDIDSYYWNSYRIDRSDGSLAARVGGGNIYRSFNELMGNVKLWREGNYLVVTTYEDSYILTNVKGDKYYVGSENSFCE